MDQMDIFDYMKGTSEDKKKQKKKKAKFIATESDASNIKISDIFTYHNRKYICLGAQSGEDWKVSEIIAVKLREFQKKNGIISKDELVNISLKDEDLKDTFEFPLTAMPGKCRGYWLNLKSMEYTIFIEQGEEVCEERCHTQGIKKTKYKELMNM